MESKQINKQSTSLIRIDTGLKHLLKVKAAHEKTTIRALVEVSIADLLVPEK